MQSYTKKFLDDEPPLYYEQALPSAIPSLDPLPAGDTVTPDQCVIHLKFLAALADLQDSVTKTDGLFGLYDSDTGKFQDSSNEGRARVREKRWAVYTARAVDRYTKWWERCIPTHGNRPTIQTLREKGYNRVTECSTEVAWSENNMPPLGELI